MWARVKLADAILARLFHDFVTKPEADNTGEHDTCDIVDDQERPIIVGGHSLHYR